MFGSLLPSITNRLLPKTITYTTNKTEVLDNSQLSPYLYALTCPLPGQQHCIFV